MFEGQNIHLSPIDGKRLCSFSQKICKQHRLNGYAFCIRHILEDQNAPFKRCQFKTKANGEKCFNPVPASADRIYCSSHLQVLGMIPKNPTKQCHNKRKMAALKNKNKKGTSVVSRKSTSNKRSAAVAQKINKNAQKILEGDYDKGKTNWYAVMRKLFKRTAYNLHSWQKQGLDTEVYDFLKERKYQKQNKEFFKVHMIDDGGEEEGVDVSSSDVSQTVFLDMNERVHHNLLRHDSPNTQEQKMLLKLKHRKGQLKQVVKSNMKKASLSYSVLSKLISSARKSAVQTTNILNLESGSSSFGSFHLHREKKEAVVYQIPCSALISGDECCSSLAMPYSKYCSDHISRDGDQCLFSSKSCIDSTNGPFQTLNFLCGGDVPSASLSSSSSSSQTTTSGQCKRKSETPATTQSKRSHQRLKPNVEEKRLKKKKSRTKKKTSKRPVNSMRNEMQKKFGIPAQPVQKLNAHLKKDGMEEEEEDDEEEDEEEEEEEEETSEVVVKQEEELSNSCSEEDDEAEDILTPEEAFHLPPGSLSFSPRMVDDDAMPTIQSRKGPLEDDDDELLQCTSNFPFDSSNQLSRDITSPTLNQLSSSDFASSFNNIFMSPAKTLESVPPAPINNNKTNYQQTFSTPICRPNNSPIINNRFTHSSQPVAGMVNDQKAGSNMLKISRVDMYNKQTGKVPDNTMYVPKQLQHADRNVRNSSFNSIANNSMHNNKMMTQFRNNEMASMNNHHMNVANEPMNTYTHMPGGVVNRSHNVPIKDQSIGYDENSLSKRYLSDSLLMQQPLSQDSTLFDDINTDVESPLEKVNPDIFFSSVFPVSTSTEGI